MRNQQDSWGVLANGSIGRVVYSYALPPNARSAISYDNAGSVSFSLTLPGDVLGISG